MAINVLGKTKNCTAEPAGFEVKQVLKGGYTRGYNLKGKFYSLKKIAATFAKSRKSLKHWRIKKSAWYLFTKRFFLFSNVCITNSSTHSPNCSNCPSHPRTASSSSYERTVGSGYLHTPVSCSASLRSHF